MTEKVLAALAQLDTANDNHWTADNLPRLEAVKMLAGDQTLTRDAVSAVLPGFTRAGKAAVVVVVQETKDATAEVSPGPGVADEETKPQPEETSLAEALEGAKARLVAAAERKATATQEHAQASDEVDRLLEKIEESGQGETLADHLGGYFRAQQVMRDNRAQRINELRGVNLRDLLPQRAAIDTAMARKTGRGVARPVKL